MDPINIIIIIAVIILLRVPIGWMSLVLGVVLSFHGLGCIVGVPLIVFGLILSPWE